MLKMNVKECISNKRSVRAYTEQEISDEVINELINLGTKASTGSNHQPWGFVVIKNKDEIQALSEETKTYLLKNLEQYPYLQQYKSWLTNPKFSVFNHANCLIIVYGDTSSHWYVYDCTLAAGNIMLSAHDMGLGTCWIGFAEHVCNAPEFKEKYNVPENFELVCPMSIGYMKTKMYPPVRKEPNIFWCR
ncbi:nitroreductase family protein [Clostridium magnum]|uniref:Nitroreductase A n=1 Tax=Clostridium magnum DSM 2767 TaxID=1121326 RepID=A0A162QZX6_9CLOT|nr:nitroreductase [Clostridium magnum]KZL89213.1 nitroreductase A [Clostridium magnum DSM 2767]SHJ35879.1 Nitroreductase [Clostridium magnum DSM 2767]